MSFESIKAHFKKYRQRRVGLGYSPMSGFTGDFMLFMERHCVIPVKRAHFSSSLVYCYLNIFTKSSSKAYISEKGHSQCD